MRGLLGMTGSIATTVGATCALLGRWIPKPQPHQTVGMFGIVQAFHYCPRCRSLQAHIIHDSVSHTCGTCHRHSHSWTSR